MFFCFSNLPRKGVQLYKGPIAFDGLYFDGFKDTAFYKAGAIAFRPENRGHSSPFNRFRNIKFAFNDVCTLHTAHINLHNIIKLRKYNETRDYLYQLGL